MSLNRPHNDDLSIVRAVRKQLSGPDDSMGLDTFIELALYHPEAGYYIKQRNRVGRSDESDFYTASSLGPVFSRLVLAAIKARLPASPADYSFVEIGPESRTGIMEHISSHPFRECRLIRHGDPLSLPAKAIVFSNELFDAQPFRRFIHQDAQWKEAGVTLVGSQLKFILTAPGPTLPDLPESAPEGYVVDWPSGAHSLLRNIVEQPWQGLFMAFDYGLDKATVLQQRPEGSARTYSGHTMGTNLLADPGNVDITCHVIWDELEAILKENAFQDLQVQRQESLFMHHATSVVQQIVEAAQGGFSREKQTLMELLHPDNMGHKFQVLHAIRGDY